MIAAMRWIALLLIGGAGFAQRRPVHSYSIVARDARTGELGVGVQSPWFSVDALRGLLAAGEGREVRQAAFLDAQGRVAAHPGAKNIPAAGRSVGEGFPVQANLMRNEKVWPAMAAAYTAAQGDLVERMPAALDAAGKAGGDIRGKQSAALIAVSGQPTGKRRIDRVFDLRIDDHPEPLKELRRLLTLARAYRHMNEGGLAVGKKDNERALREYSAAARLAPGNAGMIYWHAVALAVMGRVEESLPPFREAFRLDPSGRELTPRLPPAGLLPGDPRLIERIGCMEVRRGTQCALRFRPPAALLRPPRRGYIATLPAGGGMS
jgi:uncharacterized Ntn-hydrolase superfamily protein